MSSTNLRLNDGWRPSYAIIQNMGDLEQKVGKRIQKFRKATGITQQELANKISMNRAHLGHLEQGRKTPSLETIEKIAKALKIYPKDLF
jgi:ribosome-binding protein aMBF1 (putative translation factor)